MNIKLVEIERPEHCLGAQHIWVDREEEASHALSLSIAVVTDEMAQAWVDANYPGALWIWR